VTLIPLRETFDESGDSSLPPAPVIETGVDRDRDSAERHGDEHPAQRAEWPF
jgi:hypothetical protein